MFQDDSIAGSTHMLETWYQKLSKDFSKPLLVVRSRQATTNWIEQPRLVFRGEFWGQGSRLPRPWSHVYHNRRVLIDNEQQDELGHALNHSCAKGQTVRRARWPSKGSSVKVDHLRHGSKPKCGASMGMEYRIVYTLPIPHLLLQQYS